MEPELVWLTEEKAALCHSTTEKLSIFTPDGAQDVNISPFGGQAASVAHTCLLCYFFTAHMVLSTFRFWLQSHSFSHHAMLPQVLSHAVLLLHMLPSCCAPTCCVLIMLCSHSAPCCPPTCSPTCCTPTMLHVVLPQCSMLFSHHCPKPPSSLTALCS